MYDEIDLDDSESGKNNIDVKDLVNVSFESIIFPNKNLPPCFYNGSISENLETIYNSYDNDEEILYFQKKHGKTVNIKKREMLDIMKEQQLTYLLIN